MFTTIVLSLLLFFAISLAAVLWRSREFYFKSFHEAEKGRALAIERARQLERSDSEISESFKGVAASALEASMSQFLNLAQSTFQQANELNKLDSEQRHKAMDAMIKPISEALEKQ